MTTVACPICGRRIERAVFQLCREIDERVARALAAANPEWRPAQGACPSCVIAMRLRLAGDPPADVLHDPWGRHVPVYSRRAGVVLPTPLRVYASPHYRGTGVTLAFIDSGFYPHPDLLRPRRRILATVDAGTEAVDERADFWEPRVTSWHGMMTSCVAAGSGYLSGGLYRGIAPEANVVLIKASTPGQRIGEREIARGLRWVLANHRRLGIDIVNISAGGNAHRGGPRDRYGIEELVADAVARGLLVVTAAGNAGAPKLAPPANAAAALTVGGLDDQNQLDRGRRQLYSSSWGAALSGGRAKPELVAPAIWVAAPILPGTPEADESAYLHALEAELQATRPTPALRRLLRREYARGRFTPEVAGLPLPVVRGAVWRRMVEGKFVHPHYQHVDGTSFAAPITAAVAAQLREAHPGLGPRAIKRLLIRTADPLPGAPPERQGRGALNAAHALAGALRAPGGRLEGVPRSPHVAGASVTFVVEDQGYTAVALISELDDWRPAPLARRPGGWWELRVPRPPRGHYAYKFLIDGRWSEDFENSVGIEDGYGGLASVLAIP